jgi:hypothetical protein
MTMTPMQDFAVDMPFTMETRQFVRDETGGRTADDLNITDTNERRVLSTSGDLPEYVFDHVIGEDFAELFHG